MTEGKIRVGRLLPGMISLAILGMATAAPAQQILSVVEIEPDGSAPVEKLVVTTPGALASASWPGAEARALTDFGVNKIFASSDGNSEQYATSAWIDTYTVTGGTGGMVDLSFTFSIDGLTNFPSYADNDFNFTVYALRGGNWSLSGYGYENFTATSPYSPFGEGTEYERVVLEMARPDGGVTLMDSRDFNGFYNYLPNSAFPGEPGNFGTHVQLIGSGPTSYYSIETYNGFTVTERRFFATHYETYVGGVIKPTETGTYADGNPLSIPMAATRANLVNSYSLLDMAVLCDGGECLSGIYPGTDLTLSFSLAAGSTFSLASILFADDVNNGTVDFFHTAKVTGITVSGGAALTSESGTLQAKAGGGYGYAAVAALPGAVPEPATWAMMIGGMGMAGGLMRRRSARTLATA